MYSGKHVGLVQLLPDRFASRRLVRGPTVRVQCLGLREQVAELMEQLRRASPAR